MKKFRNEDPVAIDYALCKKEWEATTHWGRTLARALRLLQRDGQVKLYPNEHGEIHCELIKPRSN
jgi:hypothetical protein